jgi:hypothetical protein
MLLQYGNGINIHCTILRCIFCNLYTCKLQRGKAKGDADECRMDQEAAQDAGEGCMDADPAVRRCYQFISADQCVTGLGGGMMNDLDQSYPRESATVNPLSAFLY